MSKPKHGSSSFKIYLLDAEGDRIEVRRFGVDHAVRTNFALLCNKLRDVFSLLKTSSFKVTWTDGDGDNIAISSNDELLEAISHDGECCKLNVSLIPKNAEIEDPKQNVRFSEPEVTEPEIATEHPGVVCDGCEESLKGTRFKCLQCDDYDLCSKCEATGLHGNHAMLRLRKPLGIKPRKLHRFCHVSKHFFRNYGRDPSEAGTSRRRRSSSDEQAALNLMKFKDALETFFSPLDFDVLLCSDDKPDPKVLFSTGNTSKTGQAANETEAGQAANETQAAGPSTRSDENVQDATELADARTEEEAQPSSTVTEFSTEENMFNEGKDVVLDTNVLATQEQPKHNESVSVATSTSEQNFVHPKQHQPLYPPLPCPEPLLFYPTNPPRQPSLEMKHWLQSLQPPIHPNRHAVPFYPPNIQPRGDRYTPTQYFYSTSAANPASRPLNISGTCQWSKFPNRAFNMPSQHHPASSHPFGQVPYVLPQPPQIPENLPEPLVPTPAPVVVTPPAGQQRPSPPVTAVNREEAMIWNSVEQMVEMGFNNDDGRLYHILQLVDGNIDRAIERLLSGRYRRPF